MNCKLMVKLLIDLTMTIMLLFALAFRITGDVAHEWIGFIVVILFVVHNVSNQQWYRQWFKQLHKRSVRRLCNLFINILLVVVMAIMAISGFMQSKVILAAWQLPGSMLLRQIHVMAAYWGYVLVSIHVGLHWQMLFNHFFGNLMKGTKRGFYTMLLPALGFAIAVCGVWAFIERDIYSKLFLSVSFDFWGKSAALFFVYNLFILSLFVWVTYYSLKLILRYGKITNNNKSNN